MAEIVELRPGEPAPIHGGYVLVKRVNGKFMAIWAEERTVSVVPPSPFDSRDAAFIAASRCADINSIPVIYVELSD